MSDLWAWTTLAGLGAFHGLNPAMGWLFAVGLGLQRKSRSAILASLLPIAIGHALSIAAVVLALALLSALINLTMLQLTAGIGLIVFGFYRLVARHKGQVGMEAGFRDLLVWSFLMATGHGAGAMLIPVLLELPMSQGHASHAQHGMMPGKGDSVATGLVAVTLHTLAMLIVAGVIALVVYEWVGLAFLRRGWINVDLVWALALIVTGIGTLFLAIS
ncbi:hypothetical protein ACFOW6_04850 [Fodinicurvata halophila]|uniref:Uncharacterized protein n=1 Tax=Fodinicurvata halophila TaxID=1419723 RepID=A0ABV8UJ87_9PROT